MNRTGPAAARPIQVVGRDDDPARFLDLMRMTLGPRPPARRTPEFWRWKHVENPFGASLGLYVTDEAGTAVTGLRMMLRWSFDGGRVRAARAVDTATHPAHQRQGVFSTLTRAAVERLTAGGVQVIFNTPNPVSLAGYRRLGWTAVTRWPRYYRLRRPLASWRRSLGLPDGPRRTGPPWTAALGPDAEPWDGFVTRRGDDLARLVERAEATRPPRGYRTPRTWTYLAWRYGRLAEIHRDAAAGEPYARYGVLALDGADGLGAAAIVRPYLANGLAGVSLVELFLARPDVAFGRAALAAMLAPLPADSVLAHFATGTVEHAALAGAGFHRWPRESVAFAVRPLTTLTPDPLSAASWDLSLGDLEMF